MNKFVERTGGKAAATAGTAGMTKGPTTIIWASSQSDESNFFNLKINQCICICLFSIFEFGRSSSNASFLKMIESTIIPLCTEGQSYLLV
jgi:hypothetical protein